VADELPGGQLSSTINPKTGRTRLEAVPQTRQDHAAFIDDLRKKIGGDADPYDPLAASAGVSPAGTPTIDKVFTGPSWVDQAREQSQRDQEAFARGGVREVLKDTEGTQDLAGGFSDAGMAGVTKGVGGAAAKAAALKAAERAVADALTPLDIKAAPESVTARQAVPGTGALTDGFIRAQENALYQITQRSEADKVEFLKASKALPAEAKNPAMQEKLYHRIENEPTGGTRPKAGVSQKLFDMNKYQMGRLEKTLGDPTFRKGYDPAGLAHMDEQLRHFKEWFAKNSEAGGDPEVEKLFQETIMPLQRERAQLYKDITGSGYDIEDLSKGAHRIAKGTAPHFDEFSGTDPIVGGRTLPRTTSSLRGRTYYAIQAKDGSRLVVKKLENGGAEIWKDKKVIGEVAGDIEVGEAAHVLDTPFTVKQATTKELEQHTPTEYHKNAWANTVDDLVRLRRVKRALEYLDTLKASPEWQKYATMNNGRRPPGWKQTTLPQLAGWFMDPKLAAVFDDFYGARTELGLALEKINRFATRSLFWGPLPHIENVMAHWYVGRGFDWITPQGVRSLFQDGARAIHQVYSQGKDFQRMLREGSALQSPRVTNQDFYGQLTKKIGGEMERDPERWGPIAKSLGFNKLADFVAWYYNGVSKVLWQANDVFMLQRQFELERKGMSTAKAIEEAEKHIPNYRIPTEVLRTRALSQLLQNPNVLVFARYHYGIFKSYANMLGDLVKGTPKERLDSIGNLFALGTLVFGIYPLLTAGLQKLTENPEAKKLSRGAASFPQALMDLYGGDKTLPEVIGSVMTLAPGTKTIGELLESGIDWFTGRHIYEPADERAGNWGRVAAQMIEYAAEHAISPYKLVNDYIKDEDSKSLIRAAIDQQVGLKEPTDRQKAGKAKAFKYQRREAVRRHNKPIGLIESLEKKAEDTFQGPLQ
jgi:hypothetical protein